MALASPFNTDTVPPFGRVLGLAPLYSSCPLNHGFRQILQFLITIPPHLVQSTGDGDSLHYCVSVSLAVPYVAYLLCGGTVQSAFTSSGRSPL